MPPGFSGNLIFAIIARMLCGNHLNTLKEFLKRNNRRLFWTQVLEENLGQGNHIINVFEKRCSSSHESEKPALSTSSSLNRHFLDLLVRTVGLNADRKLRYQI